MAIFSKKPKKPASRRELVASRRFDSAESVASPAQTFRRSRTISARQSEPGSSERQIARQLREKRHKVLTRLAVTLVSIGGIVVLLGQLTASINVVAPDQKMITSEMADKYRQALDGYFSSRPLERLRFLLNKDTLAVYMLEHAPEIQSAEVVYGQAVARSNLVLSFRQPVLQWVAAGRQYYVDGQGVTFERNYFANPLISVEDQSGVEPEVGQAVVNHRFLGFLGQVSAQFEAAGVKVGRIVLPDSTVRQVDFGIEGRSYAVRMTVDRGVAEQTRRAIKAMEYLEANGIAPVYVDVRVDQRVFYR